MPLITIDIPEDDLAAVLRLGETLVRSGFVDGPLTRILGTVAAQAAQAAPFSEGDRVIDHDGDKGTVLAVATHPRTGQTTTLVALDDYDHIYRYDPDELDRVTQ